MLYERKTQRLVVAPAIVAALCLVWSLPLGAQSLRQDVGPPISTLGAELRGAAIEEANATGDFVQVADRLVRRVGELPAVDAEKARCLELAGILYHHAGEHTRARTTLRRAALIAYHAGHPNLSVALFLDAAQAALENGDKRHAYRHAHEAGFVIATSDFSPREKLDFLARVTYVDTPFIAPGHEPTTEVAGREDQP